MKTKDLQTLRNKKEEKLKKKLSKMRMDLTKATVELKAGKEKNPKKIRNLRKDIAQILTIMKEKEIIQKSEDKKNKEIRNKK